VLNENATKGGEVQEEVRVGREDQEANKEGEREREKSGV